MDTLFKDYEVQNTHHENLSKCIECRLPVAEPSGHFLSFEIEKNSPNQECQTCKMFLPSKCSLSAHQRIHKRMPRHICPECGEGKNNNYRTRAFISRGLYIFTPFFSAVYNQERLILQTIYVLNKEIWP